MFFTASQIATSIAALSGVHPFHGITYLVCKQENLPVGRSIEFALDAKNDEFLNEHHRINPNSRWFFQPFKSIQTWVRPDYSAKGLQAINTQTFRDAFIHERNTRLWGWQTSYVSYLASRLPRKRKIPAFHLSVWLFKDDAWVEGTLPADVIARFRNQFHITSDEAGILFDMSVPIGPKPEQIFQSQRATWSELRAFVPPPPDSQPERGGTLAYLEIEGVGPAQTFVLQPSSRLTLITGDNGLGKTFLLECAWWALTGTWADRPAYPANTNSSQKAKITFAIAGENPGTERKSVVSFDLKSSSWPTSRTRPTIPGLTIYARVDGSFAVWDPIQQSRIARDGSRTKSVFSNDEVWNGTTGRIEGLIRDWVRWQNNPSKSPFEIFSKVLVHLSPPNLGRLEPGEPVRIPDDPRDIPTIRHPYGTTPIVYSSAGVRRVMTLAYLIVWAWSEHVVAAEQARRDPERRMVVLVDEMEAHLHPRWQRAVLPALISSAQALSAELQAQYIVATHSPLVMASAEPVFDEETDSLFHLDISGGEVTLREMPFVPFGDASSWLTSPVFDLRHARSKEAEAAIETAKALQLTSNPTQAAIKEVSERLIRYLPESDKFWPRWISFAERFGVQI